MEDALQLVMRGDPRFAARLYRYLAATPGNTFLSPASIRVALGMAYAGAAGATAEEMARTLALEGDASAVRRGFAALLRAWKSLGELPRAPQNEWDRQSLEQQRILLRVVSRLFGQQGYSFRKEFLAVLATEYGAPLCEVDFREPEAVRTLINDWIEEQTEKRIRELIQPGMVNADTRMVLCNAVHFKARWTFEFSEHATRPGPFFVDAARSVDAPLMSQTQHYGYAETKGAQLVELPYGAGGLAMLLVVPRERDGLARIESKMDDDAIAKWTGALSPQRVHLTMPRFRIDSAFRMKEALAALGMRTAFEYGPADFSGMDGSRQLCVSEVIHQAFVEVDERGTEAAAASAVVAVFGAPPPKMAEPIELRADRPFLFLIRDVRTATVLFMGRLANPTA
jgi:serpin B